MLVLLAALTFCLASPLSRLPATGSLSRLPAQCDCHLLCAVCMPFPHDREQLSFVVYYSPEFSRYSRTQYLTRDEIGVELIRQVCMDGEGVLGEGGGSQPRTSATRRRAREAQQLRRDGAGIRGSGQGCRESRQGWSTESSRTRRHLCRLTATTPDAAQPPRVCAESALVYAERRASCPGKC